MRYLPFASRAAADERSAEEAAARGCGPVTTSWWASEADPDSGAAVLLIDEGDEGSLDAEERARLSARPPAWLARPSDTLA